MKKQPMHILFCIVIFFISTLSHGQDFMTYQEMEQNGFNMEELDEKYPNGIHPDSVKGPFTYRQEQFHESWLSFFTGLMKYLGQEEFYWGDPTYCHMKIYFDSNGNIDHWFYNFKKSDSIPTATIDRFEKLIKQFMQSHVIEIEGESRFSQCSGVTFIDLDN